MLTKELTLFFSVYYLSFCLNTFALHVETDVNMQAAGSV